MLNKQFQEAYLIFENNTSQETQATLNVQIEKLYEEKVEDTIVRSGHVGMSTVKRTPNVFSTWKNEII